MQMLEEKHAGKELLGLHSQVFQKPGGQSTFKTHPGGRKTFLTGGVLFLNLIQRGVDRRNCVRLLVIFCILGQNTW